jgi:hypothetical protein
MKNTLSWLLASFLALSAPGCIFVHVTGDLDEEFWGDDEDMTGFHELSAAVDGCLVDPAYDLDLDASLWRKEAAWTVRYASEGSDGPGAFHKAKEAVLKRIEREGGTLTEQHDDGPHVWSCSFRIDDEPGEASVALVEGAREDDARPHQLEVTWEQSD